MRGASSVDKHPYVTTEIDLAGRDADADSQLVGFVAATAAELPGSACATRGASADKAARILARRGASPGWQRTKM